MARLVVATAGAILLIYLDPHLSWVDGRRPLAARLERASSVRSACEPCCRATPRWRRWRGHASLPPARVLATAIASRRHGRRPSTQLRCGYSGASSAALLSVA